ncbi:hypothetical protein PZN02_002815 [Sinorhizobium garamanticum]|uniref:Uncharacterized protein n=1 Tax=Sinorhizobium garamanticum TaxID=680247 RepID=A0ABY8DJ97_9HYPH|nr:hypothetical protein [Sinorhizobium garamanticum]WEX89605.1 hypothetical protein PZN02_002815 [Sinorhizobium garamanticum]
MDQQRLKKGETPLVKSDGFAMPQQEAAGGIEDKLAESTPRLHHARDIADRPTGGNGALFFRRARR